VFLDKSVRTHYKDTNTVNYCHDISLRAIQLDVLVPQNVVNLKMGKRSECENASFEYTGNNLAITIINCDLDSNGMCKGDGHVG
jgi:hypothetical protein